MNRASTGSRAEQRRRIEREAERCIELYRDLGSMGAVAAELGLTPRRVARRLRDAQVSPLHLRVERAIELYRELGDVRAVARRLRLSEEAVRGRLFSGVVLGLLEELPTTPRAGRRLASAAEQETVALYRELRSLRKVGERLGITQEGVRLRLRNAGIDTSCRDRLDPARRAEIVELYEQLESVQAVARRVGRCDQTIRRALLSAGVTLAAGRRRSSPGERAVTRAHHLGQARVIQLLYDRLGSEVAVADALGISQGLVSRRLCLLGAAPGRGNHGQRGGDPELLARLRSEFDTGVSVREAARRSGIPYRTALRWLHRDGATIRSRPGGGRPLEPETYVDTYKRYRETYSPEEVAHQIGRSVRTVNRRLNLVSRAIEHHRAHGPDGSPALQLLPPDEPPRDVPAWVNPSDVVTAETNDLRELERSPRGAYICPLCRKNYWGRSAISQHLHQPHVRCREPGCERAFVVGGLAAHRWNAHGGRAELEALKRRQRAEAGAARRGGRAAA